MRKAIVCIVMLAMIPVTHAAELFVSPTGNDAGTGKKSAPFKTLERARDAIRDMKKNGGLPSGGVTVFLDGGDYPLTNTFMLTAGDSGEPNSPVSYQAVKGQVPVITGARAIEGWRKVTETVSNMTAEAAGKLFVADVPAGWLFNYLYVNGQAQTRSRWANNDQWRTWPKYPVYDHNGLNFGTNAPLGKLPNNGDVEIFLIPNEWWNILASLRNINPKKRTANFVTANPVRPGKWSPGWLPHEYNFMNALALIDEPGEWCVDSAAGKVYYWPPDGAMAGRKVAAPAPGMYQLLRLEADPEAGPVVHHVNFKGLTFRCADRVREEYWPDNWLKRNSENPDGAIYVQGAEDCVFSGNTITDVGACGMTLAYRVKRILVEGNLIQRTGSCGIYLYGWGAGNLDTARDNTICRNFIRDVGQAPYWHAAAISLVASSHNTICHNFLLNMPYAGVSIAENMAKEYPTDWSKQKIHAPRARENAYKQIRYAELPTNVVVTEYNVEQYFLHSGDNRIERNIVHHYMTRLSDGGALYCWGVGDNGRWVENVLVRTNSTLSANGIYMDDETDLALVASNRVWGPVTCAWFDNSHSLKGKPIAEMCTGTTPPVKASGKSTNRYIDNIASITNKPAGYDELVAKIVADVKKAGGWPGNPVPPDTL